MIKAMKRNSSYLVVFRESSVGARRQKQDNELALELPAEMIIRDEIVGQDGFHR